MTLTRLKRHLINAAKVLADWILPLKVKKLIIRALKRMLHLDRKVRLYRGMHKSLTILPEGRRLSWEELGGEFRPAIDTANEMNFTIRREKPFAWVQLGFGVKNNEKVKKAYFSINGSVKGTASSVGNVSGASSSGRWYDMRLKLDEPLKEAHLEVRLSGESKLYVSDPIVPQTENQRAKNIICIILDGIQRDFMTEENAPCTHAFFREGIICDQVFTQGDWTLPSFSSMFTGLYPHRHGVHHPRADVFLPQGIETLPEVLQKNGFRTLGYSSHKRFAIRYGHARGFERFIYRANDDNGFAPRIVNEAIEHLESHRGESNFLFLHIFDTHYPFMPRTYYQTLQRSTRRSIDCPLVQMSPDEKIKFYRDMLPSKLKTVDRALQAFYTYLQEAGEKTDTQVILTSDHGLPFRDQVKPLLLQSRVHVPLFVRGNSLPKHRETGLIEGSVDLLPSILHLARIDDSAARDGRKWPFLGGRQRNEAFSESLYGRDYNAVFRDAGRCMHLRCPLNLKDHSLNLSTGRLVTYKRSSGKDIENDTGGSVSKDEAQKQHLFFKEKLQKADPPFRLT